MEKQVKNSGLTKADWISLLVWIVVFCPLTFLGFSLKFNLALSFLFTAICFGFGWGSVKLLKFFKQAEDHIRLFRVIESIVGVIIALIIVFLIDRPMVKILTVSVVNKSELQDYAKNDVEKLEELFSEYEAEEEQAINATRDILKSHSHYPVLDPWVKSMFGNSYSYADRSLDSEIHNYITQRYVDVLSKNGARSTPTPIGVSGDYMTFKQDKLKRITKLKSAAESFNIFTIPSLGMKSGYLSIEGIGQEILAFIEAKRTKTNEDGYPFIFEIASTGNIVASPTREFSYHSEFKEQLDDISAIRFDSKWIWISYLIALVINALMYFSYFISYRSSKVEITRRSNKSTPLGGAFLD